MLQRTCCDRNRGMSDKSQACNACQETEPLGFRFSMAFQPIVDVLTGEVLAEEALARGPRGESAASVLAQVTESNRYRFDQAARVTAIEWASRLGMKSRLSINFMPNAVYNPDACIQRTLHAARAAAWVTERIIFEVSESEPIEDRPHLLEIFRRYREFGFKTAIDDFGAGHSGLGLLMDFQPDYLKLDMALIRDIDRRKASRAIVRHAVGLCDEIGIQLIAEGVETLTEAKTLVDLGVRYQQGYYFARPAFESLSNPILRLPN